MNEYLAYILKGAGELFIVSLIIYIIFFTNDDNNLDL